MARFRDRRIMLLIFLALICGGLILGAGPRWGVDITGGSRIYLRLEASWVTLNFAETPSKEVIDGLIEGLEEDLNTSVVSLVSYEDVQIHNQIVLEIGKIVTENMISPFIGGGIEIQSIEEKISDHTRDEVIDALYTRVDPYGTLGAQFKSLEKNYVLFEIADNLEDAKKYLGHRGRLEIFIENKLVLRGEHIKDVDSPEYHSERGWEVPFELTDDGAKRFADASENKGGYPGVIYLDRPDDAILLFDESFLNALQPIPERERIDDVEYSENTKTFRFHVPDEPRTTVSEAHWFYIQVSAVRIQTDFLDNQALEYLREQRGGLKTRVIWLGELKELSENMVQGENLVWDNEVLFPIEEETKLEEFTTEWLARVAGAESWPTISEEIAGKEEKRLVITTGSEKHAGDLYIILSQRLPVEISIESESWIEPRLGEEFLEEAAKAGLVAFLAVGAIVYLRYRRFKIAIPLMMTMACEVIIPLGVASAAHSFMTFGIAEIGALIAVVGTGVDHQIIISDEVLTGVSPSRKLPIKRRVSRAFTIIFAAAATTIAAMVMLGTLGFGAMRGFAIITTLGILVSVLITRPAYARIIGALLERESRGE